jgi:hypothetical protein
VKPRLSISGDSSILDRNDLRNAAIVDGFRANCTARRT